MRVGCEVIVIIVTSYSTSASRLIVLFPGITSAKDHGTLTLSEAVIPLEFFHHLQNNDRAFQQPMLSFSILLVLFQPLSICFGTKHELKTANISLANST